MMIYSIVRVQKCAHTMSQSASSPNAVITESPFLTSASSLNSSSLLHDTEASESSRNKSSFFTSYNNKVLSNKRTCGCLGFILLSCFVGLLLYVLLQKTNKAGPNDKKKQTVRRVTCYKRLPRSPLISHVSHRDLTTHACAPPFIPFSLFFPQRVVINTWWRNATEATFEALMANYSALDSAIEGCVAAEIAQGYGDHTVGPDGSPDTNGETTLDAMIVSGVLTCVHGHALFSYSSINTSPEHSPSPFSSSSFL